MYFSTSFIAVFFLFSPTTILAGLMGDNPSCIGLELATNFFFSGDVTSQTVCEEACSTLFMDATGDIVYDTTTLDDGTTVQFCECGSQGVLCQDIVEEGGGDEPAMEDTESPTSAPVNVMTTSSPMPTTTPTTTMPTVASAGSTESPPTTTMEPPPTEAGVPPPTGAPPTTTPTSSAEHITTRNVMVIMTMTTLVVTTLLSL